MNFPLYAFLLILALAGSLFLAYWAARRLKLDYAYIMVVMMAILVALIPATLLYSGFAHRSEVTHVQSFVTKTTQYFDNEKPTTQVYVKSVNGVSYGALNCSDTLGQKSCADLALGDHVIVTVTWDELGFGGTEVTSLGW